MTRNDPRLDLCGKHSREVYNYFVPTKNKGGRPKGSASAASVAANKARQKQYDKMWDDRKKRVLTLLSKEPRKITEFEKSARMKRNVLQSTLRRLRQDGKAKREGWSYGARWALV